MNLKNLFKTKPKAAFTYQEFWNWFSGNAKSFHQAVIERTHIEKKFFNKLSTKLNELKDGFWYVTGMMDENTAELIITADGTIRNIVFVEELVDAAPHIEGWKFTALKPSLNISDVSITLGPYEFRSDNLHFCPSYDNDYPDEIDLVVTHPDLNDENKTEITNGVYIFLDNYLGELDFATTIDNLRIISTTNADKELIPVEKLKDYLNWRQKEFVEKYEGTRHNTENDHYAVLEAELESANSLIAVINTDLLAWDSKASHPWMLTVEIPYDGSKNNGMPDKHVSGLLNNIEEEICEQLTDNAGYLNLGRQTVKNTREIYFACKEFRKLSKLLFDIQKKHAKDFKISYDIFKDKYWRSLERFQQVQ